MANKLNNCYLINAPAGSGKTTEIKSIVQRCIIDNPKTIFSVSHIRTVQQMNYQRVFSLKMYSLVQFTLFCTFF